MIWWLMPGLYRMLSCLSFPRRSPACVTRRLAGFQVVTRERATDSKYVVPHLASYLRYRARLPTVPDLVIQAYLKADLTYKENKHLAMA